MCIINGNAVWGRLSKNYLTQNLLNEIFSYETFAIYGTNQMPLCTHHTVTMLTNTQLSNAQWLGSSSCMQ